MRSILLLNSIENSGEFGTEGVILQEQAEVDVW